jgi:hypothetical protein
MTVNKFQGFIECMNIQEAPTPEEWARIKAKIDVLTPTRVFLLKPEGYPSLQTQEIPPAVVGEA